MGMRYAVELIALLFLSLSCLHAQETPAALTIDEAVRTALANNPTIRGAREQASAAKARIEAASADELPQVSATAQYIHTSTSASFEIPSFTPGVPPGIVSISAQDNTITTIATRQELYTGGRISGQVSRAESLYDVAVAQLGTTESQLAFQTRNAYYGVLLAQSLVRSAEQTLASARAQLDVATARFEVGTAAQFDVLRAQTQVSEAEQSITQARNQVEIAGVALNRAMGVTLGTVYTLAEPAQAPIPEQSLPSLIETAEHQRGEVLAGRAQVAAAAAGIKVAKAARLPDLSASADYEIFAKENPGQTTGWTFFATVTQEIFDGGRISANISEARSLTDQAQANLEETTRLVEEDVWDAYLNLQTARQTIETARVRLRQAQEAYDVAVVRYEAGVGTAVELADALAALTSARTNLDQAIFNYNIAYAQLQRALGRAVYP